jgi:hypothetical protein
MIDKLLVKYLRWRGWVVIRNDVLIHEDRCVADARGYITGYPQFGRVSDPFDRVDIFTAIEEKANEDRV